jgi:hypothetical protein
MFAGINNFKYVKEASTMPDEQILELAPAKDEAIREYFKGRMFDMMLPIILAFLSFKAWQWSYNGKSH